MKNQISLSQPLLWKSSKNIEFYKERQTNRGKFKNTHLTFEKWVDSIISSRNLSKCQRKDDMGSSRKEFLKRGFVFPLQEEKRENRTTVGKIYIYSSFWATSQYANMGSQRKELKKRVLYSPCRKRRGNTTFGKIYHLLFSLGNYSTGWMWKLKKERGHLGRGGTEPDWHKIDCIGVLIPLYKEKREYSPMTKLSIPMLFAQPFDLTAQEWLWKPRKERRHHGGGVVFFSLYGIHIVLI